MGNLWKFHRDGDRSLQLLVFNEEFLVSVSHQLALTMSLPFVHTARRSYRLNGPVKCSDCGDVSGLPLATSWEVHWTLSFRGRRSRNKVSVGEPAEGSLSICLWLDHEKVNLVLSFFSLKDAQSSNIFVSSCVFHNKSTAQLLPRQTLDWFFGDAEMYSFDKLTKS